MFLLMCPPRRLQLSSAFGDLQPPLLTLQPLVVVLTRWAGGHERQGWFAIGHSPGEVRLCLHDEVGGGVQSWGCYKGYAGGGVCGLGLNQLTGSIYSSLSDWASRNSFWGQTWIHKISRHFKQMVTFPDPSPACANPENGVSIFHEVWGLGHLWAAQRVRSREPVFF